jgi:phage FluMu protein Com
MQTVQFTCAKCGKVMAISTEHLGTQVHCPHCMEIVQAPPPPTAPEPAEIKGVDAREGEDIFGTPSDEDIFGAAPKALVEMPEPPPSPPPTPGEQPPADSVSPSEPTERLADSSSSADSQLPPATVPARPRGNSMFVPMLLIFLVPYAIVCTVYIAWNLINPRRPSFDPLELMRDPNPKDGGPRVIPTAPLPNKLKTSLKKPIKIGDLEVTPLKVHFNGEDFTLDLKMVNLSRNLTFNPISNSFIITVEKRKLPYTFLDTGKEQLYGGYLEWWKLAGGKKEQMPRGYNLGPGEEMLIQVIINDKYRKQVKAAAKSKEPLVWRVQVRRGFVTVNQKPVSATAVIGVEFTANEIDVNDAE